MDTYMSLAAYGDGAREALAAAAREINRLERELSRTIETSDVYKLNAGVTATVGDETAALLRRAVEYSEITGGLFDVTVAPLVTLWGITSDSPHIPSQSEIDSLLPTVGSGHIHLDGNSAMLDEGCAVDLGGIAKGYASDRVAQVLAQYGVTGAAVALGGNVYICGQKPDGALWSVAVQDPKDTSAYAMTLELTDTFAVTSGGYQRFFTGEDGTVYQPGMCKDALPANFTLWKKWNAEQKAFYPKKIIAYKVDHRTGKPAVTDILSVTVVAGNGTMADAYSTALYVMGEEAACDFWRQRGGFDMVLITADGRVLYTPGLAAHITQKGASYDFRQITT